jgi:hypothetical protein
MLLNCLLMLNLAMKKIDFFMLYSTGFVLLKILDYIA